MKGGNGGRRPELRPGSNPSELKQNFKVKVFLLIIRYSLLVFRPNSP